MNETIRAIYHILCKYQYGIWTINLLRVIWSSRIEGDLPVGGLEKSGRLWQGYKGQLRQRELKGASIIPRGSSSTAM